MIRSSQQGLSRLVLALAILSAAADLSWASTPAADVVRGDWHFRESLSAIRDWESLLERLEKESPDGQAAPVFPVPIDGRPVTWPNPVPLELVPVEDRNLRVRLRVAEGRVEVQRARPGGRLDRQTVDADAETPGYSHPGGGGKDQWYHRYDRRFDRLLKFRPRPAPLGVAVDAPLDLLRGSNELAVTVANASDRPLQVAAQLEFHRPKKSRLVDQQTVDLPPGASEALRFGLLLEEEGGGLAVLALQAGGERFSVPLLTHVEDVTSVLGSIEQVLADTPNPQAAESLADLKRRAEAFTPGAGWRSLFEEACRLRDELLLGRIPFDAVLFIKRKPYFSEQPFMDAHHLYNRPGGGIYRLSPVRPGGKVTPVIDSLGEGVYRDVCLDWDAETLLFAFGNGSDKWDGRQSYDVYEVRVDGTGLRRLTAGPKNDCEPFYLPDGRIGFTSDRSEHFVMCGGDRHSPTLFAVQADGSEVRQLSYNMFNDFTPAVLPDGRILYGRWEYNERSVTSLHNPFTMNPDGTMVAPYYGNATIRPNVVMFPRPVPGTNKVTALFTAHHGQTHGAIGLIDVRRGVDGPGPLTMLTPNVPLMGERAEDSRHGWHSDPVPLSETTYLCSYTPTVLPWLERSWALYLGDRHGNLALVYRDPEISCAEPVPLVPRPRPFERASVPAVARANHAPPADAEAELALVDVYVGLTGVPPGTARYLRVLEDVPRKDVRQGGVVLTSGTPIFTVKRVLGTVPIEPDGSAYFTVPADRNVYFEVLDADRREIQRMRSVVCLRPGERRACIGCHEPRTTAPPNNMLEALGRQPSRPAPPPWGTQILSFLRDVQPVLNARCVQCHTHDRLAGGVILTDDLTDQFTVAYEELLPYLSVANANRWDHPDDVYPQPPYTYGSKVSQLMTLLESGHYGVELTETERLRLIHWIDANAVYYDRYENEAYGPKRHIFTGPVRQTMEAVYARRCASCHGSGDGSFDTWWLTLNRHDVKVSRALIAPLARSAGGWQRCGQPVFADREDPDYQAALAALTALADRLVERPREDLLSIRGTEAELQTVELPPPPAAKADVSRGPWVYLSDVPWESARSGWTPNGDGLPRRNRDVANQLLRLGRKRYRKGIGTHAPSEIVYRLDGKYDRFRAAVGGAEDGGTVVFQVFADGRLLFQSGLMHGLGEVKSIDVSVAGASELRLVVTDAGDNYYRDMANWADARLLPAGAPSTP